MTAGSSRDLANLARRTFLEALRIGVSDVVSACSDGARTLASQAADPVVYAKRRDLVLDLPSYEGAWRKTLQGYIEAQQVALAGGSRGAVAPLPSSVAPATGADDFTLVEDAAVEQSMLVSRLAQTMADRAGWEYTDLTARLSTLDGTWMDGASPLDDVLKPQHAAQWLVDAWMTAGLGPAHWATLQTVLHDEASHWAESAYHDANRVLLEHGVRPEIDLRAFIRRAKDTGVVRTLMPSPGAFPGSGGGGGSGQGLGFGGRDHGSGGYGGADTRPMDTGGLGSFEETRQLTQTPALRSHGQGQAALGKLNQLVSRQVPEFDPGAGQAGEAGVDAALPSQLGQAIAGAQRVVQAHADTVAQQMPNPGALVRDLQAQKQQLKAAATTQVERAVIEIVALLFQSILMDERLPAMVRVWFARLQMPVLRVAVAEPDFFATLDHPARALIDRMGACVMGFAGGADGAPDEAQDHLQKEIKRVVQTIEAYPDTGRRVFQTVLVEFEAFLERYFREGNEASRKGVSLAEQVEQREAYAIQYTIELRKMLATVPVHEGVRDFLFKVWADVLANSAVHTSPASDDTKALKLLAGELIWSASAKTSRDERNQVLQRLPPLLKALREGMTRTGMSGPQQEVHLKALSQVFSAAFSAKAAAISAERMRDITGKLEALDGVLPELGEIDLDTDTLRDLSGHESEDLEVVAEGGTMPTPAMMSWAGELKLGAWFDLDYRHRHERVQLAWRGRQRQLLLFVTPQGRGILFQVHRLAAFLQAGLLVPQEEESLTVRATRDALAKLDADPERLLN
jgi:hypothetical protein